MGLYNSLKIIITIIVACCIQLNQQVALNTKNAIVRKKK